MGGGSLFRIPFGVPMGMTMPRPMMAMRTSYGFYKRQRRSQAERGCGKPREREQEGR